MKQHVPSASRLRGVFRVVVRMILPAVAGVCIAAAWHPTDVYSQKKKKCVDCHKDMKAHLSRGKVHKPAKESCETCHKRHGFKQKLILVKGLPELCVDCHEGITEAIASPNSHKALEQGGCTVCHDPHASRSEAYLRETAEGTSVCLSCHAELADVMAAENSHEPFRKNNCSACHEPHASDRPGLLIASEQAVCESCHENVLSKHKFVAAADYACSDCHDPHGSSKKSPLAEYAHEPFSTGECDACHDMDAGDIVMADDFPPSDLCAACHEEKAELVEGDASHFGSDARRTGGTATCLECHSPHTSDFGALLTATEMDACFKCHGTLATKETYRGLMHPPYAEGKCATCHEPHGGGGEHHLAQESSALCASCHEEITAPLKEGQVQHEALGTLECIECHSGHAAQNAALLSTSLGATCHSCHDQTKFSVPHAPYSSASCNVCHQNHARRAGLLPAPEAVMCVQCHQSISRSATAKVQHPPMNEESCSLCHAPHGSEHKGLLSERQDDLCFGCHDLEALVATAPASGDGEAPEPMLHTPVAEGNCAGCHDVHGAEFAGLVPREAGDLCYSCHTDEKVAFAEGIVHKPVADGSCGSCHTPHGAADASLSRIAEPDLCTQCHDFSMPPLLGSHQGLDVAVSSCTTCHNPHNSPVEKLLNPVVHAPFAEGDCSTCHEGPEKTGAGAIAAVSAGICIDCHDDMQEGAGHHRIEGVTCTQCHSPHASRFASLLSNPSRLCKGCHEDILNVKLEAGQTLTLHKPIENGSCLDCHRMHDPPGEHFIASSQGELCASCHPSIEKRSADLNRHDPFAKGKCASCHATHASADPHLLKKEERRLCKSCHRLGTDKMASAHNNVPLSGEGCTSCHDPHSSPKAATALLHPSLHVPYQEGDCASCHDAGGEVSRGIELCTGCHDEKGDYANAHNAGKTAEGRGSVDVCLDCHSPHAGHAQLFRRSSQAETCLQCHDRRDFNRKLVHAALEDGCTTCHDVHESNFSAFKREALNDLCITCHEESAMHAHPIGTKYVDPRTGGPLICTSCHEPHSSDHEHILTFDHRRDLCVQCHQGGTMKVH